MDTGIVKLKTAYYITCEDVEKLTGRPWDEFEFAKTAENDSYVSVSFSEETLAEMLEEFEDIKDELFEFIGPESYWRARRSYAWRLKNQIELVKILREQFSDYDEVLIWVSW